ncbi:hypothetical protein DIPPA_16218 [Diplonema papillatum]|nr:hypothetical protein DIPPA_16218 [Diplonema papillatum]
MFRNEYILAGLDPGSFTGGVVPGYGTRAQAERDEAARARAERRARKKSASPQRRRAAARKAEPSSFSAYCGGIVRRATVAGKRTPGALKDRLPGFNPDDVRLGDDGRLRSGRPAFDPFDAGASASSLKPSTSFSRDNPEFNSEFHPAVRGKAVRTQNLARYSVVCPGGREEEDEFLTSSPALSPMETASRKQLSGWDASHLTPQRLPEACLAAADPAKKQVRSAIRPQMEPQSIRVRVICASSGTSHVIDLRRGPDTTVTALLKEVMVRDEEYAARAMLTTPLMALVQGQTGQGGPPPARALREPSSPPSSQDGGAPPAAGGGGVLTPSNTSRFNVSQGTPRSAALKGGHLPPSPSAVSPQAPAAPAAAPAAADILSACADRCYLVYKNQKLAPAEPLSTYGVEHNDVLHMHVSAWAGTTVALFDTPAAKDVDPGLDPRP